MKRAPLRVYLDLCCLKRPFDDLSQERVRIEAEAVMLILERIDQGLAEGCNADALLAENALNPVMERRTRASEVLSRFGAPARLSRAVEQHAAALEGLGFDGFDALHLAAASAAKADILLTCDDRLLRLARRLGTQVPVRVTNPVDYVREATGGLP